MNIKHGDIITLENGDVVEVSLKTIKKNITELVPLRKYKLKGTGNFCNAYDNTNKTYSSKSVGWEDRIWTFLNFVDCPGGKRAIFLDVDSVTYLMYTVENLNFVVDEV